MAERTTGKLDAWAKVFMEYRGRLLSLAARNLNPVLSRRVSPEDLIQEAFEAACKRIDYLETNPEVPVYFKLRTILLQVVTDCERRNLQSQKRDAYKEVEVEDQEDNDMTASRLSMDCFAASVTSPASKIAKKDRYALLQKVIDSLPENDRQILLLRNFDGLSNQECAEVLKIDQKAASIRYVRALEHLHSKLVELTEFHP